MHHPVAWWLFPTMGETVLKYSKDIMELVVAMGGAAIAVVVVLVVLKKLFELLK